MSQKNLIVILVIILVLIILGTTVGVILPREKPSPPLEKELNIYNWEAYLSEEVMKNFETKFGVKVNLEIFEDSNLMFSAVQSQPDKYDLIVSEDWYVLQMKTLKLLSPLEHQKIPNLKYLKKEARENDYDFNNTYCMPYVSGYTGIVVNTKYLPDYDGTRKAFWDEKYKGKISMPNNPMEVLMNAVFLLGYSPAGLNEEQLQSARELALKQKNLVIGYDDPIEQRELLVSEDAWLAYIYTTEVLDVINRNPDLKFFAPKEGALLWADNFCIPKDAPHKNAAHAFLNYLLEPEVSAKNSQDIGAVMVNQEMGKFLSPEFSAQTKDLDFPIEEETLSKSGYFTTILKKEVQFTANQLWSELGIEAGEE